MDFSVHMPNRQVTLRISVERPEPANLDRLLKKQRLSETVARDLKNHQDNYFLFR